MMIFNTEWFVLVCKRFDYREKVKFVMKGGKVYKLAE